MKYNLFICSFVPVVFFCLRKLYHWHLLRDLLIWSVATLRQKVARDLESGVVPSLLIPDACRLCLSLSTPDQCGQRFVTFYWFLGEPVFVPLMFPYHFSAFAFCDFCSGLHYFFSFDYGVLFSIHFPDFLRWEFKIINLKAFIYSFTAVNFPDCHFNWVTCILICCIFVFI